MIRCYYVDICEEACLVFFAISLTIGSKRNDSCSGVISVEINITCPDQIPRFTNTDRTHVCMSHVCVYMALESVLALAWHKSLAYFSVCIFFKRTKTEENTHIMHIHFYQLIYDYYYYYYYYYYVVV